MILLLVLQKPHDKNFRGKYKNKEQKALFPRVSRSGAHFDLALFFCVPDLAPK